jgi:hypothetical protein
VSKKLTQNRRRNNMQSQSKPPVDREAVRVLAIELGAREAARRSCFGSSLQIGQKAFLALF